MAGFLDGGPSLLPVSPDDYSVRLRSYSDVQRTDKDGGEVGLVDCVMPWMD